MGPQDSEPEEGEVREPQRPPPPSSTSSTNRSQGGNTAPPVPTGLRIKDSAAGRPSYESHTSPAPSIPSHAIPSLKPGPIRSKVAFPLRPPPSKVPVQPPKPAKASPRKDATAQPFSMKGAAKEAATRGPTNGAADGEPTAELLAVLPSPLLPPPPPPTPAASLAIPSPRPATPPRPASSTLPRPPSSVPSKPLLPVLAQQGSRPSSPLRSQPLRADLVAEAPSQSGSGDAFEGGKGNGGETWGHGMYGREGKRDRAGEPSGQQSYGSRERRDGGRRDEAESMRSRSGSIGTSDWQSRGSDSRRDRRSPSRERERDRRSDRQPDSYRPTHRDDDNDLDRDSGRYHSSRGKEDRHYSSSSKGDRREREGRPVSHRRRCDDEDGASRRGGDARVGAPVVLDYDDKPDKPAKRRKSEASTGPPRKSPSRSPRSPSPQSDLDLALPPPQKSRSRQGPPVQSPRHPRSSPRQGGASPRRRSRSPRRPGPQENYGKNWNGRSYDSYRPDDGPRSNDSWRSSQDQSAYSRGGPPQYGDSRSSRPYEQRSGQSQGGGDAWRDGGGARQREGFEPTRRSSPPRPSSSGRSTAPTSQGLLPATQDRISLSFNAIKLPPPPPPPTSTAASRSIFAEAPPLPAEPPPPPPPLPSTTPVQLPPPTPEENQGRPQSPHAPLHPSISALNSRTTSPTTATPESMSTTSRTPGPHTCRAMAHSGHAAPPGGDWLREPSPEPVALEGMPRKDAPDEHPFVGSSHISEYTLKTKLGEGTFGLVWLGIRGKVDNKGNALARSGVDKEEEKLVSRALKVRKGDVVALKEILVHNESDGMPITSLREIRILKALNHPNVVPVVDIAVEDGQRDTFKLGKTYMVFPYMDHDLAGLLENSAVKFETHHIKQYAKQLLQGTAYLHKNGILHRDMKAANLLINNKGVLMVADFGLARSIEKVSKGRLYTNCVVTRWYRPPELLLGDRKYHTPVDMWGVGCVIAEMFKKKPIFPGTSDVDQAQKIFFMCGSPNEQSMPGWSKLPGCEGVVSWSSCPRRIASEYQEYGEDFVDLMEHLLVLDPRKRLTAVEALDHQWFWTEPYPTDPKLMPVFPSSHEFDRRKREETQQAAFGVPLPRQQPVPLNHGQQPRQSFGQAPPQGRPPYGAPPLNGGGPQGYGNQPMRFDMGSGPLPPPSYGGPPPGFAQASFQGPFPPPQQRHLSHHPSHSQQPPFHQQQQQHQAPYPSQRGPNYGGGDQRGPAPSSSGKVSMMDMLAKRPGAGRPPPAGPRPNGESGQGAGGGAGGRSGVNYSDV